MKKIILIVPDDSEIVVVLDSKPIEERTIADLRNEEEAYTTPWGLVIASGTFMIKSDHPVAKVAKGTFSLRIKKSEGMIFVDGSTIKHADINRTELNSWIAGYYREAILVPEIMAPLVF